MRLLRLLRLLRLAKIARALFPDTGVRYAALVALLTALVGGSAFASAEKEPTAWDGIWWAITTMTTVGYGDLTPQTDTGRVIAIGVMIVGIGFMTMLVGAVAERFVLTPSSDEIGTEGAAEAPDLMGAVRSLDARLARSEAMLEAQAGR